MAVITLSMSNVADISLLIVLLGNQAFLQLWVGVILQMHVKFPGI